MSVILFDMDGTLIDSTDAIYESFCSVFAKHKMPRLSKNEVAKYIGYTLNDMFAFMGVKAENIKQCCDDYKMHYTQIHNLKTTMLPNAINAIKLAHSFATLGIVTTKTSASSRNLLEHFGVAKYFKAIVGREDVLNPKPHSEPILKALSQMEVSVENAFMIGDTILDLIAAKEAKITGIGVLCGYGTKEDLSKFSDKIFNNTLEAVEFIKMLCNA